MERTDYVGIVSRSQGRQVEAVRCFLRQPDRRPAGRECPLVMACRLTQSVKLPVDTLYIGDIVEVYTEERFLTDGKPDVEKIDPFTLTMPDNGYWKWESGRAAPGASGRNSRRGRLERTHRAFRRTVQKQVSGRQPRRAAFREAQHAGKHVSRITPRGEAWQQSGAYTVVRERLKIHERPRNAGSGSNRSFSTAGLQAGDLVREVVLQVPSRCTSAVAQCRPPPKAATSHRGTGITSKPRWSNCSICSFSEASTQTVLGSRMSMFIESHTLQKENFAFLSWAGLAHSMISQSFFLKNSTNSGVSGLRCRLDSASPAAPARTWRRYASAHLP